MSFLHKLRRIRQSGECVEHALLLEVVILQRSQERAENLACGYFRYAFFIARQQRYDFKRERLNVLILLRRD